MREDRAARARGDAEWHFLEARRLIEAGAYKAAMEQAGLGVRIDLERPEGYVLLGEINLLAGDAGEARKNFHAAARRANGELLLVALAGAAQAAWAAGDWCDARERFEEILEKDPADPINVRPAFAELLLASGDAPSARDVLARCEDEVADVHVLASIAAFVAGDVDEAVTRARRAFLANVYLPAALRGAPPPDFGLVHGIEEGGPEHASALAERLQPILEADPGAAAFLGEVAGLPEARKDGERLVALASKLQAEPDPARRRDLIASLDGLRDPSRLAADARKSAARLPTAQRGPSAAGPSFEV